MFWTRKGQVTLYHGTSLSLLESILEKGLVPIEEIDIPEHDLYSEQGVVYLTTGESTARTCGMMTNERLGRPYNKVMIVVVEVKDEDLIPDESFLKLLIERGHDRRLSEIKTARECLAATGYAAHRGRIGVENIHRIYEIDVDSSDEQRLLYIGEFLRDRMMEAGLPLPKLYPPSYDSYESKEQGTLLSRLWTRLKATFKLNVYI